MTARPACLFVFAVCVSEKELAIRTVAAVGWSGRRGTMHRVEVWLAGNSNQLASPFSLSPPQLQA